MDMIQVDKKQIQELVRERNLYKQLLTECLHIFNRLLKVDDIATKVEQALEQWDPTVRDT